MDHNRKTTIFTVGEDWDQLTTEERITLCRSMADEAQRYAESVGSEKLRTLYLEVARQWALIAEELQRERESKT